MSQYKEYSIFAISPTTKESKIEKVSLLLNEQHVLDKGHGGTKEV